MPQIWPLTDTVHPKYRFTYLLTYATTKGTNYAAVLTDWTQIRTQPARWPDLDNLTYFGTVAECTYVRLAIAVADGSCTKQNVPWTLTLTSKVNSADRLCRCCAVLLFACSSILAVVSKHKTKFLDDYRCTLFAHAAQNERVNCSRTETYWWFIYTISYVFVVFLYLYVRYRLSVNKVFCVWI